MDIKNLYRAYLDSTGVNTDTRKITKGNIFFALKGENFNGNAFAEKAVKNGATLAVIDEPEYLADNCILVDNTLVCLQELARYHRAQLKIPVIGLTGSNGKTTTKELMYAVLAKRFNAIATNGNLNNHIGVPLTILSISQEHEIAIVEMGANHQKEIEFLCTISQPDLGYITNYGKAHLEGFGGVEGVIKGKSELYDYLSNNNKKALINSDDPLQIEKSGGIAQKIFFGTEEPSPYCFELGPTDDNGYLSIRFNDHLIKTQLTGDYNFSNVCSAISLGIYFRVPVDDIIAAIKGYQPHNNRSELKKTPNNTLFLDMYNANPSSLEAALTDFDKLKSPSKWIIIGDMFEMGPYEREEHQRIADLIETMNFEKKILVGQAFSKSESKADKFQSTDNLLEWLRNNKPKGKTIFIKGSRGMKLERATEYI